MHSRHVYAEVYGCDVICQSLGFIMTIGEKKYPEKNM